jgi:hypothetical protein
MKVTKEEISNKFDELVNQTISREEIANWAAVRQQAEDQGKLEYNPKKDEKKIWKAITYLIGVDLKDGPNSYLHSIEDFLQFRREIDI